MVAGFFVACDWQSERVCYAGGMRRILNTDVLALVGLLLIGLAVYLAFGLAATLGYAGAALIGLAGGLAVAPAGRAG